LNAITFLTNFIMSIASTCYGIKALSSNDKKTFWKYQILMVLNLSTELVVSIFFIANLAMLILRIILFLGVVYLVQVQLS